MAVGFFWVVHAIREIGGAKVLLPFRVTTSNGPSQFDRCACSPNILPRFVFTSLIDWEWCALPWPLHGSGLFWYLIGTRAPRRRCVVPSSQLSRRVEILVWAHESFGKVEPSCLPVLGDPNWSLPQAFPITAAISPAAQYKNLCLNKAYPISLKIPWS